MTTWISDVRGNRASVEYMSNQTHNVATDALETLGTFPIPDNSGRDAIHLAVEPAIAGARLRPGERAKIEDGIAVPAAHDATGIVDPFLDGLVQSGQRFWFVVLPRTITSLRHVWSHPAFPEAASYHTDADEHYVAPQTVAERWLRDYAKRIDEPFDNLIDAAKRFVKRGDYFYGTRVNDEDGDGYFGKFEGQETHPEFWRHYQDYTWTVVPDEKQRSFFTCSC